LKLDNHFFLTVLLFGIPLLAFSQTASYDDAIQFIVLGIESKIGQNEVVAIIDFKSNTEQFSDRIVNDLSNKLIKDGIKIVERKMIEYIFEEQNFQMSGNVSDDSMVSIGHMLGAKHIVVGNGENMADYYRINFTMLSVESAEILMRSSINVKYDSNMMRLLNNQDYNSSAIGNTRFSIGVRLGPGFEINTADEDMVGTGYSPKEKSNIAFNAALYVGFRVNNKWSIQPELNFIVNNGMEVSGQGYTVKIDYTTLDIPLLIRWDFILSPVRAGVVLGPYLSLPIGKLNLSVGDSGSALDTVGITYGATAGFIIGYKVGPGYLTGDIRFLHDFGSLMVREDFGDGLQDAKIGIRRSINLTFGYEFSL
jgi:TolB-like protein